MHREPAASPHSPRRRILGAAAVYFGGTLALVELFRVHAALHVDTARDLLLARDCAIGLHCSGAGPRSSFAGWMQGALWSHLLELRELLGLGLAALEHAANLALALAAALVPLVARAIGRPANALTWALWLPATLLTIGYPTLWNPTLWPLTLGLFYLALARAAHTRHLVEFAAAAAAFALALDVHVGSAVLLPCFLAAVVACAARPWLALATVAACMVVVLAVDSPGAFAENGALVVRHAPVLALALALPLAAGLWARRRLAGRDATARAQAVVRACVLFSLLALPLLALGTGHPLHARYFAPLVTPAAILLTARTGLFARRFVHAAALALVCAGYLLVWHDAHDFNSRVRFRLVEVEAVAAALYDRGLDFAALYRRLRGPYAFDLLSTLAVLEPPASGAAPDDDRDLLVVRATRADLLPSLPPDWTVVGLDDVHVAVIVPYRPWVRVDPVEICRRPAARPDEETCVTLPIDVTPFARREGLRWAARAFAELPGFTRPNRGDRILYRMTLHPQAGGPGRRIRVFADACKHWALAVPGAAAFDPRIVDIPADGATRELVFSVTASPRCRWWLPPFAELSAPDPAIDSFLPPLPDGDWPDIEGLARRERAP